MSKSKLALQLDELCQVSRSISCTQASQLSATQRTHQRHHIRSAVLQFEQHAVDEHINSVEAGEDLKAHFCLILSALSHVSPTDTADNIDSCTDRFSKTLTAVLTRMATDDDCVEHATAICRMATVSLDGMPARCIDTVIDLVVGALEARSPAAPALIQLLPTCVSVVQNRSDGSGHPCIHLAKAHDGCKRLCVVPWPQADTVSILKVSPASLPVLFPQPNVINRQVAKRRRLSSLRHPKIT